LDNPTLDTTQPHGRLLLQLLAIIGEFERSLVISRTSEGRARAKANGIKFGRRHTLSRFQQDEARARLAAGETTRNIARTFGVSHSTIARL
jgi:DNA invertase Pin-like site-specific DNA recombinase